MPPDLLQIPVIIPCKIKLVNRLISSDYGKRLLYYGEKTISILRFFVNNAVFWLAYLEKMLLDFSLHEWYNKYSKFGRQIFACERKYFDFILSILFVVRFKEGDDICTRNRSVIWREQKAPRL